MYSIDVSNIKSFEIVLFLNNFIRGISEWNVSNSKKFRDMFFNYHKFNSKLAKYSGKIPEKIV